jgi:hypothetical protein
VGLIKNKLVKGCMGGPKKKKKTNKQNKTKQKKVCSHVVTSVAQAGI